MSRVIQQSTSVGVPAVSVSRIVQDPGVITVLAPVGERMRIEMLCRPVELTDSAFTIRNWFPTRGVV